ncbi:MAG TPA: tetratricopeptide repeat protein [Candidatus Acidoferrales bacterium]|nr:tetratricopeptide repeat protein [Candidatus Acidoferrales bacterium]
MIIATVYLHTAFFDFAYDDFGQIVFNQGIKSWSFALRYFQSDVWAHIGGIPLYYRPVYMIWLAANYKLFGLTPLYWHVTAIAVHLLACLLFYFFAARLTGDKWVAIVAVFLFGLHPVHVEDVAWISGATETLLAALVFGSLLCYFKHRDSGQLRMDGWQAASLLLAVLAVMTKETGVILPAFIGSYEWVFRRREASRKDALMRAARAAAPYVLVSIGYVIVRALALRRLAPPHTKFGLVSTLLAWPKILVFYIAHLLLPLRLSAFYNLIRVEHPGWSNFALPVAVIAAGAVLVYYGSRRSRVFAFLSLWCLALSIPMLNVTLLYAVENVHDRYLFLPSAALCVILASLLARLKEMGAARTVAAVLTVIAAGYAFVTVRESQYWMNDEALGQHGIAVSPGHPLAPQVVANAYIRAGRIEEALPYLVDASEAQPDNVDTLAGLGLCYSEMGALSKAAEYLTKAIAVDRFYARTHLLLGSVRLQQNRLDEAETEIRKAMDLQRFARGALFLHYYLGKILYARGNIQGALREYLLEASNDPTIDPAVVSARAGVEAIQRQLRLHSLK